MHIRNLSFLLAGTSIAVGANAQSVAANDLRSDSAHRTSSLADAGGGWEKGSFFITDGGANKLSVYGFTQFRYLMNFRDDEGVGENEDITTGFQMRRARIGAKGSIWDKNLTYDIVGEFSRSSGSFGLLDALGQYKWDNGAAVKWGQYKLPFMREELVSDTRQLAVERSTVNAAFTMGRAQAVSVGYEAESFRGTASFSDGGNTLNTDFTSAAEADFAFTARGEFRWGAGDFKRFDDFTSWRESEYAGMVGAAIHYQDGGETGGTADVSYVSGTIDCSIEGNGWNAYVAGVWGHNDPAGGSTSDDFGLVGQAGFFVTDQVEIFGRYDGIFADDITGEDFHVATGGFHYYISPQSHAVKFSADVQYYFDAQDENALVSPNTGSNLLADTEDGQIAIRLQMQVMF